MNKMYTNKKVLGHRVIVVLLMMLLLLCLSPQNVFAATQETIQVDISQEFAVENTNISPNNTFDYKIQPENSTNPMPPEVNSSGIFTMQGNGTKKLTFTFTSTGVYKYEIQQRVSSAQTDYTYDQECY